MLACGVDSVDVRGDCHGPRAVSVNSRNSVVDSHQLPSVDKSFRSSDDFNLMTLLHPSFSE